MGLSRRNFMATSLGILGATAAGRSSSASDNFTLAQLRGTYGSDNQGLRPGATDDQSKLLQSILDKAATNNRPVFLPPGNYVVSNINIPANTRLMGVPGASKLIYSGGGHCLLAENCEHVEITGIVVDGIQRKLGEYAEALINANNVRHLIIENCEVVGSVGIGIYAARSAGRIERNTISGITGDCGIFGVENNNMLINANKVRECSNGGILVHRWSPGEDGTIISNNHISQIDAVNGGTGQWGNGINLHRAHSVQISGNQISDCKFSAIRSNGGSNVQITANSCRRSGETAIYSEFEFVGAIISNNLVDTCARGIAVVNFLQGGRLGTVSNNIVRNVTLPISYEENATGAAIGVEAETTVTGNIIENSPDFGLTLGWGPYLRNVIAIGNVIRGSDVGIYVSVVEGCKSTIITNNIITDYKAGAILGYRWDDLVTQELGKGSSGFDHLDITANRIT